MALAAGEGAVVPGRAEHPRPLASPPEFIRCGDSTDVFFRWAPAWGGHFLGTEGIGVSLFNGGYPLQHVMLRFRGHDDAGKELFNLTQEVDELPRGREVKIEIASYELPGPPRKLSASLVSADFGPEE